MPKNNLYQVPDLDFINAVKSSSNVHQVLVKLGRSTQGGAYLSFYKKCEKLNIDTSHFKREQFTGNDRFTRNQTNSEQIISVVKSNISLRSTLKELYLNPNNGTNIKWIKHQIQQLNIDTTHWLGQSWNNGDKKKNIPLDQILIENSTYTSNDRLKKRLVNEGMLEYKCSKCNLVDWNGQKLSLHLEHKNGNHRDNRLQNICFLCPNCHSQTPTFCRRKGSIKITTMSNGEIIVEKKSRKKSAKENFSLKPRVESHHKINLCELCNKPTIKSFSKLCRLCFNENRSHKVTHPSKEELEKLLWERPTSELAKQFGVSDNAIAKWAKGYGISKPPRGYWTKKQYGKI